MTELKTITKDSWTNAQAFALAAVSLLLGVCGGWVVRRATTSREPVAQQMGVVPAPAMPATEASPISLGPMSPLPSPEDLKKTADNEAAPLLEQIRSDPTNASLLAKLGNVYYDAKQYPAAIDYYERSLKLQPADASVRTDLGTAYWYSGNADTAIRQFDKALSYEPSNADTLFNLGIVQWQGKHDKKAAATAWQKLLHSNPGYANRDKVQQLIAQTAVK
jgi:cytochrome c-type biogenesis protein CcmH/NrfG